jgi:protein-tyrosine phosphatase
VDLLVSLGEKLPVEPGEICPLPVLWLPLQDFGGVPSNWEGLLKQKIIPKLADGQQLVFFCHAGHGRTGTALASLIALLEDETQTPDPIRALRDRYCQEAVETARQQQAVFALRGQPLPVTYA